MQMTRRQIAWLGAGFSGLLVTLFVAVGLISVQAVSPNAWTNGRVNLRSAPGSSESVIATLDDSTPIVLEARSLSATWVLGHSITTSQRGWMSSAYLRYAPGFDPASLPLSTARLDSSNSTANSTGSTITSSPTPSYIIPTAIPDVMPTAWAPPENPADVMAPAHLSVPILPIIDGPMKTTLKRIYALGQKLGNYPMMFSKVGDCMTDAYFMYGLGNAHYMLGSYTNLQDVVKYFSTPVGPSGNNAFNTVSQASYSGLTANLVLSDEFTSVKGQGICNYAESMLQCEYRTHKPSFAVIMLGFSETQLMQVKDFDKFMRAIVQQSIDKGIIPILTTFPENAGRREASREMNKDIVDIASAYDIPIINLDRALYDLPHHGVDSLSHLTIAPFGTSVFTAEGLRYGMNMRELLTLEALDRVWKSLQQS